MHQILIMETGRAKMRLKCNSDPDPLSTLLAILVWSQQAITNDTYFMFMHKIH